MSPAGPAPRPLRRPMRATLAPSTVRLLVMYLEAQGDDFAAWLSGARRTLTDEDALALDENMAVFEVTVRRRTSSTLLCAHLGGSPGGAATLARRDGRGNQLWVMASERKTATRR